jgi:hypothetical protein
VEQTAALAVGAGCVAGSFPARPAGCWTVGGLTYSNGSAGTAESGACSP